MGSFQSSHRRRKTKPSTTKGQCKERRASCKHDYGRAKRENCRCSKTEKEARRRKKAKTPKLHKKKRRTLHKHHKMDDTERTKRLRKRAKLPCKYHKPVKGSNLDQARRKTAPHKRSRRNRNKPRGVYASERQEILVSAPSPHAWSHKIHIPRAGSVFQYAVDYGKAKSIQDIQYECFFIVIHDRYGTICNRVVSRMGLAALRFAARVLVQRKRRAFTMPTSARAACKRGFFAIDIKGVYLDGQMGQQIVDEELLGGRTTPEDIMKLSDIYLGKYEQVKKTVFCELRLAV